MPYELCKSLQLGQLQLQVLGLHSHLRSLLWMKHKRHGTRAELGGARTNLGPIRMGTEILQLFAHLFSLCRS